MREGSQASPLHWWRPPWGFERPAIIHRAQTPLSWFNSWNNHQRLLTPLQSNHLFYEAFLGPHFVSVAASWMKEARLVVKLRNLVDMKITDFVAYLITLFTALQCTSHCFITINWIHLKLPNLGNNRNCICISKRLFPSAAEHNWASEPSSYALWSILSVRIPAKGHYAIDKQRGNTTKKSCMHLFC